MIDSFRAALKTRMPYTPKVKTNRWGSRGKYIPAGKNKNTKPNNR